MSTASGMRWEVFVTPLNQCHPPQQHDITVENLSSSHWIKISTQKGVDACSFFRPNRKLREVGGSFTIMDVNKALTSFQCRISGSPAWRFLLEVRLASLLAKHIWVTHSAKNFNFPSGSYFYFIVVWATFFWIGRLWLWHRIGFSPRLFVCGTLGNNHASGIFNPCRWDLALPVCFPEVSLYSAFFLEVSGLPIGHQHITNSYSDLTIYDR